MALVPQYINFMHTDLLRQIVNKFGNCKAPNWQELHSALLSSQLARVLQGSQLAEVILYYSYSSDAMLHLGAVLYYPMCTHTVTHLASSMTVLCSCICIQLCCR